VSEEKRFTLSFTFAFTLVCFGIFMVPVLLPATDQACPIVIEVSK